ncbi:MAG: hypothetical protein ABI832_05445 [bacterium]
MDRTLFALSLGFAALILLPSFAHATPQCAAHQQVVDQLATTYGEARISIGLAQDNTVMEVFASAATGTWTLTATLPNGMTCLVIAGKNFETRHDPLPASGYPA